MPSAERRGRAVKEFSGWHGLYADTHYPPSPACPASLNAIKSFIGNNGSSSGSGGSQQQIIGAAMSQAAALFDQKSSNGQVSGGDKQSAVNQAGEAVMKLMIKHQVASSGSLGSLASQFM